MTGDAYNIPAILYSGSAVSLRHILVRPVPARLHQTAVAILPALASPLQRSSRDSRKAVLAFVEMVVHNSPS